VHYKRTLKRKSKEGSMGKLNKPMIKKTMGDRSPEMQKVDMQTGLLVQELMNASTSFHKLHLQVTGMGSYAQHKALGEVYEALPDLADSVAEGYQGACEIILQFENQVPKSLESSEDAIQYLREIKYQVDDLQSVMPHSEIVNILDTVKDAVNSAKYKLIFLS
tara:strand:- start:209 stop:697 length:489 start_codon:yes stop_codon:yes gene_type:complete